MRVSTAFYTQRGLNSILEQQARLADIQEQVSSGKRLLRPSDDPTGAAQILRLEQAIAKTDQYQRNADSAVNRLVLEEATLDSVQDSLLRVRDLAVQGSNATLSDTDRLALAQEARERLKELMSLANTRDANQEYLFSGYQVNTKPFSQAADGTFIYNGDQGQRALQISTGRSISDSDSGSDTFVSMKNGNGTFQINANVANTGTGIFNIGQVIDPSAYVADTYTITIAGTPGNLTYGVTGVASGVVIAAGTTFTAESAIQFNGIQTGISGTPVAGDVYTVAPSSTQDMFSTVQKLVTALETSTSNSPVQQSRVNNSMNQFLSEIDIAFDNVTRIRTNVGARLKTIDDQVNVNESFKIEMASTLSSVRDLDIAEAAVELQSRLIALEAAQATYSRIQGLSLFEFI
ncbi:MAG: flagellar hook-associated protein FlgL [Proteobacteria bacterium]|nr:flagellar hook-associated protein 3 [Pseudomonadota bacterium]NOG58928.1 flagellar hook-associated protein FlgL [Pseudomonadota bacterium]